MDNEVGSFPSYRYFHDVCEFTVNKLMFSEELVSWTFRNASRGSWSQPAEEGRKVRLPESKHFYRLLDRNQRFLGSIYSTQRDLPLFVAPNPPDVIAWYILPEIITFDCSKWDTSIERFDSGVWRTESTILRERELMVCMMGTSSLGRIVLSGWFPDFCKSVRIWLKAGRITLLTCSSFPSKSIKFGTSSCLGLFLFTSFDQFLVPDNKV